MPQGNINEAVRLHFQKAGANATDSSGQPEKDIGAPGNEEYINKQPSAPQVSSDINNSSQEKHFDSTANKTKSNSSQNKQNQKAQNDSLSSQVGKDVADQAAPDANKQASRANQMDSEESSEISKAVDSSLNEAAKNAQDKGQSSKQSQGDRAGSGSGYPSAGFANKELGEGVLSKENTPPITSLIETKKQWQIIMRKMMAKILGVREVRSQSKISRRYKGQFGAPNEIKAIKNILLLLDRSGSFHNMEVYRPALATLFQFGLTFKKMVSNTRVGVVLWGTSYHWDEYRGLTEETFNTLMSTQFSGGGTTFGPAVEMGLRRMPKPDLILIATDGEFSDTPSGDEAAKFRKQFRRMIWVVPTFYPHDLVKPALWSGAESPITSKDAAAFLKSRLVMYSKV